MHPAQLNLRNTTSFFRTFPGPNSAVICNLSDGPIEEGDQGDVTKGEREEPDVMGEGHVAVFGSVAHEDRDGLSRKLILENENIFENFDVLKFHKFGGIRASESKDLK